MKITRIETTPLRVPYRTVFHWAQGVIEAAEVILVEVHTDGGLIGYGESMNSASPVAVQALLKEAATICLGHSPFEVNSLMRQAYKHLFAARGTCSAPRFGALVLAGLDMALWDLMGKFANRPVYDLLGGAARDRIHYFGFPQGDTPEEIAEEARQWADRGCDVIYVKIGRGADLDLSIVKHVRAAVGDHRLRLDANEAWDVLTARRMLEKLKHYDIEFIEQPTNSDSLQALSQVKAMSPIAVAADQIAFTPEDVYAVCRAKAADLIVLGLHETGGIGRFCKAAAIAEAAGLNVCLHGLYETGITTCATYQVGVSLDNLDDGNQYMNHLLVYDIIKRPDLSLQKGGVPLLPGPGLGFELDFEAVERAAENYNRMVHRR